MLYFARSTAILAPGGAGHRSGTNYNHRLHCQCPDRIFGSAASRQGLQNQKSQRYLPAAALDPDCRFVALVSLRLRSGQPGHHCCQRVLAGVQPVHPCAQARLNIKTKGRQKPHTLPGNASPFFSTLNPPKTNPVCFKTDSGVSLKPRRFRLRAVYYHTVRGCAIGPFSRPVIRPPAELAQHQNQVGKSRDPGFPRGLPTKPLSLVFITSLY